MDEQQAENLLTDIIASWLCTIEVDGSIEAVEDYLLGLIPDIVEEMNAPYRG